MLEVNEYFDGNVKSIGFQSRTLPATVGVMETGTYTFGTDCKEIMQVVSGELKVKLPDCDDWRVFVEGQAFEIEANQSFDLVVDVPTAYFCQYIRE